MPSSHWAFDVVILGGGSLAEACAPQLAAAGKSVAIVEGHRVGGECAYVACMPAKALLRSAAVRRLVARAPDLGAAADPLDAGDPHRAWERAVRRRDEVAENRDDTGTAQGLAEAGVTIIRGRGRILRSGLLGVEGGEVLEWTDLILNTGSRPLIPPIEGLSEVDVWTSDQALSSDELPSTLLILGGSAVGCELAQAYSAFGVSVHLVESAPRLLAKEEPAVSDLLAEVLRDCGVTLHLGAKASGAHMSSGRAVLDLEGGGSLSGDRLLLASGRLPNVEDIGLDSVRVIAGPKGVEIDDRCRVRGREHIWAGGDVTGIAPFTHTANYHGRIIAGNLLGVALRADHRTITRAVYTTPPVASVGITLAQARDAGADVVSASASVADLPRASSEGEGRGLLHLVADRPSGLMLGASVIAPEADAFIGEAAVAIRAGVPIRVLTDVVRPFPSFGQLYEPALQSLLQQL